LLAASAGGLVGQAGLYVQSRAPKDSVKRIRVSKIGSKDVHLTSRIVGIPWKCPETTRLPILQKSPDGYLFLAMTALPTSNGE